MDKFKFCQSVARPEFLDMHMALDGTVLFANRALKLNIDDRTLETGLALWVQFETNGTKELVYRIQMLMEEFDFMFIDFHGHAESLDDALVHMEDTLEPGLDGILKDAPWVFCFLSLSVFGNAIELWDTVLVLIIAQG